MQNIPNKNVVGSGILPDAPSPAGHPFGIRASSSLADAAHGTSTSPAPKASLLSKPIETAPELDSINRSQRRWKLAKEEVVARGFTDGTHPPSESAVRLMNRNKWIGVVEKVTNPDQWGLYNPDPKRHDPIYHMQQSLSNIDKEAEGQRRAKLRSMLYQLRQRKRLEPHEQELLQKITEELRKEDSAVARRNSLSSHDTAAATPVVATPTLPSTSKIGGILAATRPRSQAV
mmetsp:Transcript_39869/g.64661  ORF Transcript_39869/g.64661 Transcript_39869/m.64661 type:complete len:231 (-) Transcript_39869:424-1116(-)|eukprot:CAMPEP_0184644706 /NCGR_PEP_ID=MMETSP0308-20130426/1384_1 /TAXON_ID=38269 /ORGANISM="Gloeochaete witrockiana, Strain SAG 46.84" /LENGTH=230 /DNA_ID=CAMNT_0027073391 /DNA_START=357 /DNA_END=1049 /DNA_ORIENTATION=-